MSHDVNQWHYPLRMLEREVKCSLDREQAVFRLALFFTPRVGGGCIFYAAGAHKIAIFLACESIRVLRYDFSQFSKFSQFS